MLLVGSCVVAASAEVSSTAMVSDLLMDGRLYDGLAARQVGRENVARLPLKGRDSDFCSRSDC